MAGVAIGHPHVDVAVAEWVARNRSPGLTSFFRRVTDLGDTTVLLLVTLAVSLLGVVRKLGRRVVIAPWLAIAGSWVISQVVKRAVERARPPLASRLVHPSGYAFPSGHAIESIAVWGMACVVVSLVLPRRGRLAVRLLAAAVIVAVGLSRVYLGVHWTTDVIAAWILGGAWMATVLRGM